MIACIITYAITRQNESVSVTAEANERDGVAAVSKYKEKTTEARST